MIILFEESATEFTNLGLGVLKDAISCNVKEKLNDEFDLEMEYPISGSNFSQIKNERIIFANPNPYDSMQPFRIYSITKPLKGTVMVYAHHISYDMNGIPCKPVTKYDEDGKSTNEPVSGLNEALNTIQNGAYVNHKFKLLTNISSNKTFKTSQPYNMRALLMGSKDNSLVGAYKGELKFDKFEAYIYEKRGKNRGAQVCYGYNMTDLKHESTTDKLYNGVFPFYHKETTSTETTTEDSFKKAYIVGTKPFQDGWLSFTDGGEPYHPLDNTPVQIATEGDYMDKVYAWDTNYQKYVEKIYNESVTLIQGVIEPSWIVIDWKQFPRITCRANAKGYFKNPTDMEWGPIKGVGDVIFEGNILRDGLNGLVSNMVIYFAEVIPSGSESNNTEITDVVEVILDDPIIKVNTSDANAMTYDKILSLDLTSEFKEEPTKEQLRTKAEEYISKNQIGTIKHTTTVSFIDLQNTTESGRYKNFEHIELGDTVRVIYRDSGVDVELRVISYEYNVLANRYEDIELGEKEDSLSTATIQNGDSISSLTNDVGYADITTVNKLIASTITAEYLQAVNAKLSKAQIEQLSVEKIECKGIIEASQFVLDELVAKLLVADNAKITETLEAGLIKVAGNIEVKQGSILIGSEDGTVFKVDEHGNLEANSVNITGGSLNINDNFEVTNDGVITAKAGKIGYCEIDEEGGLKSGDVESFDDDQHDEGVYICKDGIRLGKNFTVDKEGVIEAKSIDIIGGSLASCYVDGQFEVQGGDLVSTQSLIIGQNDGTGDRSIALKKGTSSLPETITVTSFSYSTIDTPRTKDITFRITVSSSKPGGIPTVNSTWTVTVDYLINGLRRKAIAIISIPSGGTSGTGDVSLPFGSTFMYPFDTDVHSQTFPSVGGTIGLIIDSNLYPSQDNSYDLGSEEIKWKDIYASNSVIQTSDRKDKTDINYNIDAYDKVFDELKPASFKFVNGSSNRTHLGFIAQDIEQTLIDNNIDTKDFACLIKSKNSENEEEYVYGLRYGELHALEVNKIKKLEKEIEELKSIILELTNKIKMDKDSE